MDKKWKYLLIVGTLLSLVLAFMLSPYASESPDGLEKVAEDKEFIEQAEGTEVWEGAPMPDYSVPALGEDNPMGTRLAGLIGTIVVLLVGLGIGYALKRRRVSSNIAEKSELTGEE